LALEAASEQVYGFQHGVIYVSLAPVPSAEGLAPAVAQALRLVSSGRDSPRQQVLRYLRRKEMLLVLDNYEHLLAPHAPADPELDPGERGDGAGLVVDILRAAPHVRILITSRARLNVPGEQLFHVGGLAYPAPDPSLSDDTSPTEYSARYGAVQLFLRSARRVREGYEPAGGNLVLVARICQMVQGMPLAILLAAAWMEVLNPAEIADQVSRGLAFLEVDWRGVPERHRSMLAVFDASWGMLSAAERAAFKRLSVFRGGFTAEAAEAVAGASLRTLRGLIQKSFLGQGEGGRYEIHELLRQYAERKLDECWHWATFLPFSAGWQWMKRSTSSFSIRRWRSPKRQMDRSKCAGLTICWPGLTCATPSTTRQNDTGRHSSPSPRRSIIPVARRSHCEAWA
jgi:hypothetical protein